MDLPTRSKRIKHGTPCSRCGATEHSARCPLCGTYFCVTCIDVHLNDDDTEFCEMMRLRDPNNRPVELGGKGKLDWTIRQ